MIFADTDLVARIERAECNLLEDCARAAQRRHPAAGVTWRPVAGGLVAYTGPDSPLNKLAGLGFAGLPSEDTLDELEALFASHGTPLQVELANLAEPALGELLTRRGYRLRGFENVLGLRLPLASPPESSADVCVSDVPDADADRRASWLDTAVTGFAIPDARGVASHESFPRAALERAISDMTAAQGFELQLAHLNGQVAGASSLRLTDGVAQLCGAATLEPHRRRGVQTALLAERLQRATRAGCDLAVLTARPGSTSQHNAQRRGFALLYTRAMLVR